MKAIEYITKHEEYEMGYHFDNLKRVGFLAAKHEDEINKFHESFPEITLDIDYAGITLCNASRKELIAFLTAFGGNWKKEVEEYYPDKMRYFQELEVVGFKYTIKAGQVPPPPSCKIIEEEVVVPEHKEMKKKIVCQEPDTNPIEELETESEAPVETHS